MAKTQEHSGDEMEVSSPETDASGSESGSESGSDSEPEQLPKVTAPKQPPVVHPPSSSSSSSSEEGSDSESGSDPDTLKPNPIVQAISSKPMETTLSKKSRSKPSAKRPADEGELQESKKQKKKPDKKVENSVQKTPTEDVKRQLFQRLWSEDDEIAILKGMIDYRLKNKTDPVADINAFHEFIKKSLQLDGTKAQLQDKIRRLKKKYVNNAAKEKKGKLRTLSKPHELKAYELSKKIWGKGEIDNVGVVEDNETPKKKGRSKSGVKDNVVLDDGVKDEDSNKSIVVVKENVVEGSKSVSFDKLESSVGVVEKWLVENWGSISVEKRNEMNEKLRSLKFSELELRSKRINLIEEQLSLVKEAMKASDEL